MKLSVVIPSFNEEFRIKETLLAVSEFLKKQPYVSEILVVNDGSKDRTAEVVKGLQSSIKNLQLINNSTNHGKGWVTKQGMLAATGDIRVFMDADNSTKIDEIKNFLPFFEQGFQVVVGSRRITGAHVAKDQKIVREFLGWVFRLIVHILVPVSITDTQCGFKAFTFGATEQIFNKQTIFRWAFDVEIMLLAEKQHLKIKEVPITWVNDEASHVSLSGKINMLIEVLKIRWNLSLGKYN